MSEPFAKFKTEKVGRNDPCPCGSGKKYKKCCWEKDQSNPLPIESPITNSLVDFQDELMDSDLLDWREENNTNQAKSILDEIWDEYENADFDYKISMIKAIYNEPSFMKDSDFIADLFIELDLSATNQQQRQTYIQLVKELREKFPEDYKKIAIVLLGPCVTHALIYDQQEELKVSFLELARLAHQDIDIFNNIVDQLAYYGYLDLLIQGYRLAWKKVKNSKDIVSWGIDDFAIEGVQYELFSYLQNASDPKANDPDLLTRIKFFNEDLHFDTFHKYFLSISGIQKEKWNRENFNNSLDKDTLKKNISSLTNEYFYWLYKEKGKTYPKADLMRTGLHVYLFRKLNGELVKNRTGKRKNNTENILCPDYLTLDLHMGNLLHFI